MWVEGYVTIENEYFLEFHDFLFRLIAFQMIKLVN